MNEVAWDACTDPRKMLEWIRCLVSDRKLRLFACAYWRWDAATIYPEPGIASALEYAEAWAETGVRPNVWPDEFRGWHPLLARYAFDAASWTVRGYRAGGHRPDREREEEQQLALLRELFGNPFRPAKVDPAQLPAKIVGLARSIYEEQRFDQLPVLADALEDAGCHEELLLAHLRNPAGHVRGCWALDLLLDKR